MIFQVYIHISFSPKKQKTRKTQQHIPMSEIRFNYFKNSKEFHLLAHFI